MRKIRKYLIIFISIVLSLLTINLNHNIFLTDSKNLINISLTLLGLSFTSFSFISTSIKKINKNLSEEIKKSLDKLLESIEKDIYFIFYSIIVLIVIDLIIYVDIPLLNDPNNIDFGLFIIKSVKNSIINFITSFFSCLSIYAFYDLMKASFLLLKKSIFI